MATGRSDSTRWLRKTSFENLYLTYFEKRIEIRTEFFFLFCDNAVVQHQLDM